MEMFLPKNHFEGRPAVGSTTYEEQVSQNLDWYGHQNSIYECLLKGQSFQSEQDQMSNSCDNILQWLRKEVYRR